MENTQVLSAPNAAPISKRKAKRKEAYHIVSKDDYELLALIKSYNMDEYDAVNDLRFAFSYMAIKYLQSDDMQECAVNKRVTDFAPWGLMFLEELAKHNHTKQFSIKKS